MKRILHLISVENITFKSSYNWFEYWHSFSGERFPIWFNSYLNFAKKWLIQYSIQYCFTQDSIQNIIQFKINSGDSIQNIIQFNSQGMINTGRIGKVPKNWPKSVQNRQKRGLIIKNGKYQLKNWVQRKKFNSKDYSI